MADADPARAHDTKAGLQYVRKIVMILSAFREGRGALGVSEISRLTGLHKSTVSRVLAALLEEDFVAYDFESRRYRIGPGLLSLAARAEPNLFLRGIIHGFLVELNAATGETALFSVLDGDEELVVDVADSHRTLRVTAWTGVRGPLNITAGGKSLLAFSPPDWREAYIREHELFCRTPKTITDPDRLREELELTFERGYSSSEEELEEGAASMSAPILDASGRLLGTVTLQWPMFRADASDCERFKTLLLGATREVSHLFAAQASRNRASDLAT